jgi:hypothetical protein
MAKAKSVSTPGLFTLADYTALRNSRKSLNDLLGKMDKARVCGADCSMYEEMRQSIDSQLEQIELNFMTPAPTH